MKLYHKDGDHHHEHGKDCQHEHHHHHEHGEHCNHEHHHHEHAPEEKKFIIPRRDQNQLTLENFLTLFPAIELPISITSDTQRALANVQQPLSPMWALRFLLATGEEVDEYTEFMACFSLPETKNYHALVYWEATLIGSSYYLVTLSKSGVIIDHRRIAGTLYTDNEIVQTICTIQAGIHIHQVEARQNAHTGAIIKTDKPEHSFLELNEDGTIEED